MKIEHWMFIGRMALLIYCAYLAFSATWNLYSPQYADVPFLGLLFSGFVILIILGMTSNETSKWQRFTLIELIILVSAAAIMMISSYARLYRVHGIVDTATNKVTKDPSDCLYFSMVTWTTLGYGDFRPNPSARFLAASEAMLGYIVMAIIVGVCAGYFARPFNDPSLAKPS